MNSPWQRCCCKYKPSIELLAKQQALVINWWWVAHDTIDEMLSGNHQMIEVICPFCGEAIYKYIPYHLRNKIGIYPRTDCLFWIE